MDKGMLRRQTLERMQAGYESASEAYERIYRHLLNSKEWQQANMIGITMAKVPEIPTQFLVEMAWAQDKRVCIPRCMPIEREMVFHQVYSSSLLERNCYGILEPESTRPVVEPQQIDLMIVPGVVFNQQGHRIGFGGGYYDRYLRSFPNKKVALALDAQIMEERFDEVHDIPVDIVMTESVVFVVTKMTGKVDCLSPAATIRKDRA